MGRTKEVLKIIFNYWVWMFIIVPNLLLILISWMKKNDVSILVVFGWAFFIGWIFYLIIAWDIRRRKKRIANLGGNSGDSLLN